MSATTIVQLLETLAATALQAAPLLAQGQAALSATDTEAVHAALIKAEQATATLRTQVDAALDAASKT